MRSIRHWTPRYVAAKIAEKRYHRAFPDHPWLTRAANDILASYLKSSDRGLEFGSGRSTMWFAGRVQQLTSVEHTQVWYEQIRELLKQNGLDNIEYCFVPRDAPDDDAVDAAYVQVIDRFEAHALDFVLVDGIYRDYCALKVIDKIRAGGLLIIDNANWFLSCRSHSPNSRTNGLGPTTEVWEQFLNAVSNWRRIWTSSGVTDTAFFFKPCGQSK